MRDAVPHQATPDVFREALTRTAQEEGFNALLVETDYFCSLVLREVGRAKVTGSSPLVFKGGTALSKIHMGFHRLSEDLDFVVPAAVDATRGTRSRLAGPWKGWIETLPTAIPGLRLRRPLTGHNDSLQYIAELDYVSVLGAPAGVIKVEIGLREPLLDRLETG